MQSKTESNLAIDLWFNENTLRAVACFDFLDYKEKSFSFLLNKHLRISNVKVNGSSIDFDVFGLEQPPFCAESQRFNVHSQEQIKSIEIDYCGTIDGWANAITEDFQSLSFYSVWYPRFEGCEIEKDMVKLHDGDKYFLVKGKYIEEENIWEYGSNGYDPFNLASYNKDIFMQTSMPGINIYYLDSCIEKHARQVTQIYEDVIGFLNGTLYPKTEISTLDIICAYPIIKNSGAYRRKDLLWCSTVAGSITEISNMLAHETAHIWCTGADCNSWEDWLNETTANWSALLFALSCGNQELFEYILVNTKEENNLSPIKTVDGSRPDGVHANGTLLFLEIYEKYGVSAIENILRVFVRLPVKTTNLLLKELSRNGLNEIAEYIEVGISK